MDEPVKYLKQSDPHSEMNQVFFLISKSQPIMYTHIQIQVCVGESSLIFRKGPKRVQYWAIRT